MTYVVICPILILYSFGYIYGEKNQISKTGLIYVSSVPSGADIYLENMRYKNKTPATINNLKKGKYKLTLKLRNYEEWFHEITIEEGKASIFKKIIMIPHKINPEFLYPESGFRSAVLLDNNLLIFKKSSKLKDLYFFNPETEQIRPLIKKYSSNKNLIVSDIYSYNSKNIIIHGGNLWDKKFYLLNVDKKQSRIVNITAFFDSKPDNIFCNFSDNNNCLALYGNRVDFLDFDKMTVYEGFLKKIKGLGKYGKWIYILDQNNNISKSYFGKNFNLLRLNDYFNNLFFNVSKFYEIKVLSENVFLFIGDNGDFFSNVPPFDFSSKKISGLKFHEYSRKLLLWNKSNIWTADFNKVFQNDFMFSNRIQFQTIYNKGRDINQCFWAYNGDHLFFKDDKTIFLLQIMPDGKHNLNKIADTKNNCEFLYSESKEALYYLDPNGIFKKIKITANQNILTQFKIKP